MKINAEKGMEMFLLFMQKMNRWETEYYNLLSPVLEAGEETNDIDEKYKNRLRNILDEFVADDPKNKQRLISMNCSQPPAYDPEMDAVMVESAGRSRMVISQQQRTGLKSTYRFTLVNTEHGIRIAKKERLNYKGRWERAGI
ncbi:NTF2 fold immunity protein [Cohnella sp.]|uniref:NTF2 fold immunity protein n=1 Tax=Cohnella sp. TaxID=1883426 RepID=UPI00356604CB